MTWGNRFRLLLGLIVVVAIALGATLILSQRETQVDSKSASIRAISYSVGSDYAGTVIAQTAKVGDTVKKGQPLMTIQSAGLISALKSKSAVPSNSSHTVSSNGTLTLLAEQPGVVAKVGAQTGGFVNAGSALETIDKAGSLYVLAHFRLDAYDFSRIQKGARVDLTLPNQQGVSGTVSDIQVTTTAAGQADASIKVRSSQLVRGSHDGLVTPGTPIMATLHLRNDGLLGGLKTSILTLLREIGL
jgi:multidrug resistance efflux pump